MIVYPKKFVYRLLRKSVDVNKQIVKSKYRTNVISISPTKTSSPNGFKEKIKSRKSSSGSKGSQLFRKIPKKLPFNLLESFRDKLNKSLDSDKTFRGNHSIATTIRHPIAINVDLGIHEYLKNADVEVNKSMALPSQDHKNEIF